MLLRGEETVRIVRYFSERRPSGFRRFVRHFRHEAQRGFEVRVHGYRAYARFARLVSLVRLPMALRLQIMGVRDFRYVARF